MRRSVANDPGRASDSTSARVPRKQIQDNPSKTKENCLNFLGFLWWNWVFSMGYEGKNKKMLPGLNSRRRLCAGRSTPIFLSFSSGLAFARKNAEARLRE
jgi:hypothetical protein